MKMFLFECGTHRSYEYRQLVVLAPDLDQAKTVAHTVLTERTYETTHSYISGGGYEPYEIEATVNGTVIEIDGPAVLTFGCDG